MRTVSKPISFEDSLSMPLNRLEEIIDGESRVMPPATLGHHALIDALAEILRGQLDAAKYRVSATGAGLGIRREGPKGLLYRIPDLMVLSREALNRGKREQDPRDPYVWAAPELVAECLSPANRKGPLDRFVADYAERGVRELWLIDPGRRTVECLFHCGERTGDVLRSALLPNLALDPGLLWRAFESGL